VAGIGRFVYGKKDRDTLPKFIIQNACRGLYLISLLQLSGPVLIIMDRVTSTAFSGDARFVINGSDDGNVRVWKAKASEKLGITTARERSAIEYRNSLVERWKADSEVGKVSRSAAILFSDWEKVVNFGYRRRHLPKPVYQASKLKRTMLDAQKVKEERRRKHTRAGDSKPKAERKKLVIAEQT
jgi:DDB1- and CUL4-associated factor 13